MGEGQTRLLDRIPRTVVPSFFTLMNLFSGFMAVTKIYEGELVFACYLIVIAGAFDVLDGIMARITCSQSHFGLELDSLCDMVSFALAPAFLVYTFALSNFGISGLIIASLPVLCSAVRLARYNTAYDHQSGEFFRGLPVPIHAFTLVTFVLSATATENWMAQLGLLDEKVLLFLVLALSVLMVTNIPFEGSPTPHPKYLTAKPVESIVYSTCVLLIIFFRETGLLISMAAYVFTGIIRYLWRGFKAVSGRTSPDQESTHPF